MTGNPTFTILVHGEAGTGKSWLGDTAPGPRLVLDAEGRARYTPSQPKVFWDPLRENPPAYDGTWQTCVVTVLDFATLDRVYQWLRSGQAHFKSVVLDSYTEIQQRLVDTVAPQQQLKTQDWGEVLRRLEHLTRSYRDLTLIPGLPVDCVVVIAGTRLIDGVYRPLLQGQMTNKLPYLLDSVGYLYVVQDPGTQQLQRQMLVQPQPGIVAKDGTGRLPGPVVIAPNLEQLYALLGNGAAVAAVPQAADATVHEVNDQGGTPQ